MSDNNNDTKQPLNKDFREPKIRFPNHDDSWSERTIGSLFEIKMCKRIFANQTTDNGDIPFYKIGTIGSKPDAYISNQLYEEYKQKYNYPEIGETLVTCSGTIGRCLQYDGEKAYYQDSNIVWIKNSKEKIVTNDFLYLLMQNQDWSKLNKSTIKRLFVADLEKIKINFPNDKNEQNQITNLMSILSRCINAVVSQNIALKKYKTGYINSLIMNGKHAGRLEDLVEREDKTNIKSEEGKTDGEYPFFVNNTDESHKYLDTYNFDGEYIILNTGGEAYVRYYNGKFAAMSDCLVLRPKEDCIALYYYLKSYEGIISCTGFQGTGLKHLDQDWLFNLDVKLPVIEHDKINRIESLYSAIEKVAESKISLLNKIKNYLLQTMFI